MTQDLHQTLMATAAEPPFDEELEHVWGRPWGAHDEVGRLERVLVRAPGPALELISADAWEPAAQALVDPDGGWYWTRREPPDTERAAEQHDGLVAALRAQRIEVVRAEPMAARFPKAMYVRDPIITVATPSPSFTNEPPRSTMELIRRPAS